MLVDRFEEKAKTMTISPRLTAKQTEFISQYLVDLNATAAARRAGYSQKTAYAIGSENLRKPEIAKAIEEAMEERSKRVEITQDKVLKDLEEARECAINAKQFSVAVQASVWQGKHLGMFREKHELTGENGGPIITRMSEDEAERLCRNLLKNQSFESLIGLGSEPTSGTNGSG